MPNDQKERLPIIVQENNVLVDARLLYQQLQSGYQFTRWMKTRIEDYNFKENQDFLVSNFLKPKPDEAVIEKKLFIIS